MRNAREVAADFRLMYDARGRMAVCVEPVDGSDGIIVPMDPAGLHELAQAMVEHAEEHAADYATKHHQRHAVQVTQFGNISISDHELGTCIMSKAEAEVLCDELQALIDARDASA